VHNDFLRPDNPFLAFAARCTSAHPAAFEPMRLHDANEILGRYPNQEESPDDRAGSTGWRRFFNEYLRRGSGDPDDLTKKFLDRDFNDGGVLDNRPFRHATDAMPLRHARIPVSRKLVYLDPAPEILRSEDGQGLEGTQDGPRDVHDEAKVRDRPTIVENAWKSLSTLPRYEPIQEDLQRVLERNRLIERVGTIVRGMEENDFKVDGAGEERWASVKRQIEYTDDKWDRTKMSDMIKERGLAWAGYQHLRVTEVTDDLAVLLTRVAGFDDGSDEFQAMRRLVRCWREQRYDPDGEGGKPTEHAFLRRFDIAWRLRRLRFVLAKTDRMLLEGHTSDLVKQAAGLEDDIGQPILERVVRTLLSIRENLSAARTTLREDRERLWEAREDPTLREAIRSMNIGEDDLKGLLDPNAREDPDDRARAIIRAKEPEFEAFEGTVEQLVKEALEKASDECNRVLPAPDYAVPLAPDASGKEVARRAVRFHYDDFASYDMISHPILYSTGVGEELARVDVFRISPRDAKSRVDELKERKSKLAGTKLNNFGAFFEEKFRTNDILWGRLDGAERIITALLPKDEDKPKRDGLIDAAHNEIVVEEAKRVFETWDVRGKDVLAYFKDRFHKEYDTTRRFDPQRLVHSAGRSSRVFGDLLEGYSQDRRRVPRGSVVWVARLARLFWLLVEVAIPDSLANLLFRHGLKLLYVFEALMVFLGTLLLNPTVQQFGFVAFIATAAAHAAVLFLQDAMNGKEREGEEQYSEERGGRTPWGRVAKYGFAVLLAFAVVGLVFALAALGLDLPRRLVGILTDPPGTAGNAWATISRGAVMLAVVAVALLATRDGTPKPSGGSVRPRHRRTRRG
jgi:patatin-related protein